MSEQAKANRKQRAADWRQANPEQFRAYLREWRKKNPHASRDYQRALKINQPERYHNRRLKTHYGLSIEQYCDMLAAQNGVCAVCGDDQTGRYQLFHIDHNHTTGAVRGLLCQSCNLMIGWAHEEPANLRAGADYLEKFL